MMAERLELELLVGQVGRVGRDFRNDEVVQDKTARVPIARGAKPMHDSRLLKHGLLFRSQQSSVLFRNLSFDLGYRCV